MINHARTLLLNRAPDNVPYAGTPGDEYLPTDFVPLRELPQYLVSLRTILFGQHPDRLYANYRVRQYLSLLHATELREFVTALDPRITYDTDNADLLWDVFNVSTTPADGRLHVIGQQESPDITGRCEQQWRVELDGFKVTITRLADSQETVQPSPIFTDNRSEYVAMPGSALRCSVLLGASPATWLIRSLSRPQLDLGDILVLLNQQGASRMNTLFGLGTPLADSEPFKTFRQLWFEHTELAYRLGGLLLAVIYRMEALRKHG